MFLFSTDSGLFSHAKALFLVVFGGLFLLGWTVFWRTYVGTDEIDCPDLSNLADGAACDFAYGTYPTLTSCPYECSIWASFCTNDAVINRIGRSSCDFFWSGVCEPGVLIHTHDCSDNDPNSCQIGWNPSCVEIPNSNFPSGSSAICNDTNQSIWTQCTNTVVTDWECDAFWNCIDPLAVGCQVDKDCPEVYCHSAACLQRSGKWLVCEYTELTDCSVTCELTQQDCDDSNPRTNDTLNEEVCTCSNICLFTEQNNQCAANEKRDDASCSCLPLPGVCGDWNLGDNEECDEWTNNATSCSAAYSELCSYCIEDDCVVAIESGPSCWDGTRDDPTTEPLSTEQCDSSDPADNCTATCECAAGYLPGDDGVCYEIIDCSEIVEEFGPNFEQVFSCKTENNADPAPGQEYEFTVVQNGVTTVYVWQSVSFASLGITSASELDSLSCSLSESSQVCEYLFPFTNGCWSLNWSNFIVFNPSDFNVTWAACTSTTASTWPVYDFTWSPRKATWTCVDWSITDFCSLYIVVPSGPVCQ